MKVAENKLADIIAAAEEAADTAADEEYLRLQERLQELEDEMEQTVRETELTNARAAAAAEEWQDRRLRLQTDFDNLQARHVNQTAEASLEATVKLLQDFLPVLDNFDRARSTIAPDSDGAEAVNAQYLGMRTSLMAALADMGVAQIPTVGEDFDYNLHMAIQQIPNEEYDEDVVCAEMQPGYTCQGQLVRAAYVMVSSGS